MAGADAPAGNTVLNISNSFGVFGETVITWDIPAPISFELRELWIDIATDGGVSPNDTSTFTMEFCSDDACASRYSRTWSITGQLAPPANWIIAGSSFAVIGSPDLSSITKARLTILSGNSTDIRIDNIVIHDVPEPSSIFLVGIALAGSTLLHRLKQTAG